MLVLVTGPDTVHQRAAEIMAGLVGEGGRKMRAGDEGSAQRGVPLWFDLRSIFMPLVSNTIWLVLPNGTIIPAGVAS